MREWVDRNTQWPMLAIAAVQIVKQLFTNHDDGKKYTMRLVHFNSVYTLLKRSHGLVKRWGFRFQRVSELPVTIGVRVQICRKWVPDGWSCDMKLRWPSWVLVRGIIMSSWRLGEQRWALPMWRNERTYCRYFDTSRKRNHSSFLIPTEIRGRCPLPPEIWA